MPRRLWIKFSTMADYEAHREELMGVLQGSEGKDNVVIYVENPRSKYPLPAGWQVDAGAELLGRLDRLCGAENIRVV